MIKRVVVKLVGEVGDEQLCGPVGVDLGFREHVEAPVVRQHRALVGGEERAAIHFRAVDRLRAEFPHVGQLVFGQHAERLVRDVGELEADIARIKQRLRRRHQRLRHLRLHQHEAAEHAPFVGDLAAGAEIDAADAIGGTRADL